MGIWSLSNCCNNCNSSEAQKVSTKSHSSSTCSTASSSGQGCLSLHPSRRGNAQDGIPSQQGCKGGHHVFGEIIPSLTEAESNQVLESTPSKSVVPGATSNLSRSPIQGMNPASPASGKPTSPKWAGKISHCGTWSVNERASMGFSGFRDLADGSCGSLTPVTLKGLAPSEDTDGPLRCDFTQPPTPPHPLHIKDTSMPLSSDTIKDTSTTISTQPPLTSTCMYTPPLSTRTSDDFLHASTSSDGEFFLPGDSTCVCGRTLFAEHSHCLCGRERHDAASRSSSKVVGA